ISGRQRYPLPTDKKEMQRRVWPQIQPPTIEQKNIPTCSRFARMLGFGWTGNDLAMEFQTRIDCYFWQCLRALRHELTHVDFMHRISQIDSLPDEHFRENQSPGPLTILIGRCGLNIPRIG